MRAFALTLIVIAACAPASYYYNFDITDPGAVNQSKPHTRDSIEDGDVKTELLFDPTNFQSILMILTNKTDQTLGIAWDQITIINPDGVAAYVRPDIQLNMGVQAGTKLMARLVPFSLPEQGPAAAANDGAKFVLVVPMVVRGQNKEYRYHLIAQVAKM
jgi:hypothetical protein